MHASKQYLAEVWKEYGRAGELARGSRLLDEAHPAMSSFATAAAVRVLVPQIISEQSVSMRSPSQCRRRAYCRTGVHLRATLDIAPLQVHCPRCGILCQFENARRFARRL